METISITLTSSRQDENPEKKRPPDKKYPTYDERYEYVLEVPEEHIRHIQINYILKFDIQDTTHLNKAYYFTYGWT